MKPMSWDDFRELPHLRCGNGPAERPATHAQGPQAPPSARQRTLSWVLCLLAALTLLTVSSPASASYDPVASGTTKLKLDKGFLAFSAKTGSSSAPKAAPSSRPPRSPCRSPAEPSTPRSAKERSNSRVRSSSRRVAGPCRSGASSSRPRTLRSSQRSAAASSKSLAHQSEGRPAKASAPTSSPKACS